MFWKRKRKNRDMDDREPDSQSNANVSERRIWGFPCSPDIPARMKILANRLGVPLYALSEHAFQLSAGQIAQMAENDQERELLKEHIADDHVGRRSIEKISRFDQDMGDILDKERRERLQFERAVRKIVQMYSRSGLTPGEMAWAISYGLRCNIAVRQGRKVPMDLPPAEE